jgi:enoyl-CoA hydratase/carnithine racemase
MLRNLISHRNPFLLT